MTLRRILFTPIVGILAIGLLSSTAAAQDALRIGVEGAYKPFSWKEADGTLKGFDIEIAHALCEEMNRTCELVEQDWDGMIPALLANKFDAIVASMSVTEERKKRVNFSDKYYQTPALFVARKGAGLDVSPSGLAGKRIGVQRGTTHQCYLEKMFPDAELVLYGTQEEVYQDLMVDRIDAQLSDSLVSDDSFLGTDDGKDFEFTGGDQLDPECHGDGAGIALRKEDESLRVEFNEAIKAIRDSGVYQEINAGYFDFDIYGG